MLARRLLALVLLSFVAASAFAAKVMKQSVRSRGKERTYYLFVPDGLDAAHPVPLLLTLHGSGRNGASLVDRWKALAEKEKFVVAGPDSTDSQFWSAPEDGPALLRDVVDAVRATVPVDAKRIYLFGHSAGGGFALQMGLLESDYFAAVAVHAGALLPEDAPPLIALATRKIPFALFIGDRDPLVPIGAVRDTRDTLVKAGFVAELTEIPHHNHDYYSRAAAINRDVWSFLARQTLTKEPAFTPYDVVSNYWLRRSGGQAPSPVQPSPGTGQAGAPALHRVRELLTARADILPRRWTHSTLTSTSTPTTFVRTASACRRSSMN
jgi:polyhydroxybutyrate depolymerase